MEISEEIAAKVSQLLFINFAIYSAKRKICYISGAMLIKRKI